MNATKLLLLVVFLLVTQISADSSEPNHQQTIPTSTVGDIIKGVTYKVDQGRSFHMVHVPTLQKKYLFFSMTTDPIYKHLNISLSIIKQSSQTPLYRCLKEELDSCYIPKEKITVDETLFLVIESEEECEYQIKSYWSDLEHIEVNSEIRFMFGKEEQRQIYHLELEGKQFEELRIIIKPETRRFAFDKIKMYGSFGTQSDPSSQVYDFKSVHLWQDAQGIYLSRKELKQLKLNLILYGEIETVYTLQCTLVNKTHNDLAIDTKIYEYLEKNEDQEYHINYKNTTGQIAYDSFVFRVAIFTGDLSLEYYADKAKTKRVTNRQPFMYMGDIQYLISKQEIQKDFPQGLYIKAISKDRVSTFMMEFEGRSKSTALELHEHIYQFLPVHKKEVTYFKVARFEEQNKMKKQPFKVIFIVIPVIGKVAIEFRKCTKALQECTQQRYIVNSAVIKSEYRELGSKQIYTLSLDDDFWQYVNIVEKHALIIAVLTNVEKVDSFAAIEYNVGNRPEYLRENKPIESHIRKDELKIYKYVNEDPSIKKIRVHINKISGCFSSYYFRSEPTEEVLKLDSNKITSSVLQVTDNLTKEPIVIIVRGEDSATYSIVIQPIHEDENYINSITLSEDVEFKMKIGPNRYEIYEISPINAQIFFKYKSSGAVHICKLDKDNKCSDTSAVFTNNGQITYQRFNDRSLFIKLRNPSSTKTIEITSIFHSKKDNHCEMRKLGQLYKEVITEGSCYSTIIHEAKDFDVFIGREEAGQLGYSLFICDKLLSFDMKNEGEQRYRISADQIRTSCKDHAEIIFSFVAVSRTNDPEKHTNPQKIHFKYLVQYTDDRVILPDGVGYHGISISTESSIRIFTYPIVNNIETTIILTTAKRLYFLVKIIDSIYRDSTVITSNDYHLTSPSENFYFIESIYLKVTAEDIAKAQCKHCELLIYVYSKEDIGQLIDYTIEVTQNFIMLEDGVHRQGYLLGNSKDFYGFTTKKQGTLVIEVTDNNRNCAEIYLSNTEYPDEAKHLDKSYDGQLIKYLSNKEEKTSYIAVRARQNCAYSIAATLVEGQESIMKLQRGVLGYSNLKEGQVKYFTFKHLSENPFKIISLHKYGHVEFFLNKSTPQDVTDLIRVKKINHEDFTFHSNHKNRLYLDSKSKQFCKGCFYILAVKAIKHTESSIFLGDEDTRIPLNEEKVLNDILYKENSFTKAEFYYVKQGIIQVKVHSGKLQVQIQYKDQSFKKAFEKNTAPVQYNFTLNEVKDYYGPAFAVFKALADNTVYSLRIRSSTKTNNDEDSDTHYIDVNPSEPNYIYLVPEKLNCLKGYLKRTDEKLFISYALKDRDVAEQMNIVAKIDGKWTKISQDVTRNVISIAFLDLVGSDMTKARPYELCMSHNTTSLTVTAVQSQETGLLPENFEMLVLNQQTYDIYPQGDFMLDVFECRGKAKIAYGSSRSALKNSKPKILDMIGMPEQPHAIRIESGYTNVLLGVTSQLSMVRWLPINQQEERGLGYYLYNAGSLKYDTSFGVIEVIVEPIKNVKKTKTKIIGITYNLYVSNNEQELKEASLCERYFPDSVLDFKVIHQSIAESPFKFTIEKSKFSQKYAKEDNVFITVVADLVIKTPDETNEQYRFVYKNQQIPAEIFMPTQLESTKLPILISFLLVFIAAVLVFAWCCTRVIVPMISRLRNRSLIEEEGEGDNSKDKKDVNSDQLEPPPSSDRQTMNFDNPAVDTQVKMG